MAIQLTDAEITSLLSEPKALPSDYQSRLQLRAKTGHKERELDITGASGSEFQIIVRQCVFNPLEFSVILGYSIPNSSVLFRRGVIMDVVMSTRTVSRGSRSTIFTSTRLPNAIRKQATPKSIMPKRRIDMRI